MYLSLRIDFALANSADPDEMRHFHQGLHCLPKCLSLFAKVPDYQIKNSFILKAKNNFLFN